MVYLALPGELVAVVDRGLPVAGLLLQVKGQAGGASDLLETLWRRRGLVSHHQGRQKES